MRSSAAWRTCQSRSSRARSRAAATRTSGSAVERSEGEHRPPADRRLVVGAGEDGGEPAVVADRAERGGARLADQRLAPGRDRGSSISAPRTASPTTSRSPHDHAATSTTVGSSSARRGSSSTSAWRAASSAARRRTPASGSQGGARSSSPSARRGGRGRRVPRPDRRVACGEPRRAVATSPECPATATAPPAAHRLSRSSRGDDDGHAERRRSWR